MYGLSVFVAVSVGVRVSLAVGVGVGVLVFVGVSVGVTVLAGVNVGVLNQSPRLAIMAKKLRVARRSNPSKMNRMVLGFMEYLFCNSQNFRSL
jgi:hypothetical protein